MHSNVSLQVCGVDFECRYSMYIIILLVVCLPLAPESPYIVQMNS